MTIHDLRNATPTPWARVSGVNDETGEPIEPYDWRAITSADGSHTAFEQRRAE